MTIVDYILSNGQAGLLDINLNNKQKVLSASSSTIIMKDYSVHMLSGRPREGQTPEQVRDFLMEQIMELKLGNFPDWMIPAIVTNLRMEQEQSFENNRSRASAMLNAELTGVSYERAVKRIDRLSKINKQQVIDFVRKWYGDNHVVVFKRTGVDENVVKVVKPTITPVATNSEMKSEFVKRILDAKVNEILPVFIDFDKDITIGKLKGGIPVFMIKNTENKLFSLTYSFDMGAAHDRRWPVITQYLNFLATDQFTSAQIQEEFYKLGCSFSASAGEDEMSISLDGIADNFIGALTLLESILAGPKSDEKALSNLIDDILKKRANARLNKGQILARATYAMYGPSSAATYQLSERRIKGVERK
ncbi:MAG: insulinase family protein [Bacteroidetes bacterium]|nr:insulinase family protein [Bacteroidota bacterium]